MKMLRNYLLSCISMIFLMAPQWSQASHVVGGDISYACQTACNYTIYHSTFMDCGSPLTPLPPASPPAPVVSFSGNGPGCGQPQAISNWTLVSYTEITPICPSVATNCSNSSSTVPGQMEAIYKRDYNFCVPGACTQYDASWSTCCRNAGITGGGSNQDIYLETQIDLSVSPCNHAPRFTSAPVMTVCLGTGGVSNQQAYDQEGDSLIYSLVNCQRSNVLPISYNVGYSPLNPLGPNWNVSLNYATGELSILPGASPSVVSGVICIEVSEYRNGNFIGTVQREIQVNIVNCSGTNALPQADSASLISGGNQTGLYEFKMCQSDTLRLQLDASDADALQSLLISAPNYYPGLQVTSSGTNPASAIVSFAPARTGYFALPIIITDNSCPITGTQVQHIHVNVGNACLSAVITDAPCGQAGGAIDLTVSGGSAPFTYAWSNGATTEDISGLLPGIYSVAVTDANGLNFSKTFVVNASNITVVSSVTPPTCAGPGAISVIPSGGTAPYTYSWSNGGTSSFIFGLQAGGYSVTVTDANGCPRHLAFLLNQPDSCFNVVSGVVFEDLNSNCVKDPGEPVMPNRLIDLTPGGATMTDANGEYQYRLGTGSFDLETRAGRWQQLLCPANGTHSVSFANVGNVVNNLDFAIHTDSVQELAVYTYHQRVKVGDTTYHYLRVRNNGNQTMSGTLNWQHDSIFDIVSSNPAIGSYNASTNTASWNFFNLAPYQSLTYRVNTSTDSTTGLGVWFTNTATVLPILGDSIPANNTSTRTDTTRGPYDPNDKLVTPAGMGPLGLIEQSEQEMTYTVRFQNTGTDTATYVRIRDTIDIQHLDIMSFRPLVESFPYSLTIENDEVLVFQFDHINLPDSATDFNGSQGFVTFRMDHKGTLPIGTQIRNSAAIFFDFNAPIITNTTLNTVFAYPELDLGMDTTICEGEPVMALVTSPGLPPYRFDWSDGSSDPNNAAGLSQTSVNGSGNYQVTVTDALGIQASASVLVTAAPLADAAFSFSPVGLMVAFNNTSNVNTSWKWDFGDGQSATGASAQVHTYAQGALYNVRLITTNDCGTDTLNQEVDLRGVAIDDARFAASVKLVPHPVQDVSYLRFANPEREAFRLRIIDLQGRVVKKYGETREAVFEISRDELASGIYMFELIGSQSYFGKMVVK